MKTLIEFKYNNKKYLVVEQDNKIKKYVIENNVYRNKFTREEKSVLEEVISKIVPTNNLVRFKEISINDNKYEVYIDKNTNIKTFNPIPNFKDLGKLNIMFNNQNDYIAIGSFKNKEGFKRIVKIGKKLVTVLISLSVCLSLGDIQENITFDSISKLDSSEQVYLIKDIEKEIKKDPIVYKVGVIDENDNLIEIPGYSNTGAGMIDENGNFIPYEEIYDKNTGDKLTGEVETQVNEVQNEEISIKDKLTQALAKNPRLSEEEKQWFLMLEPVIVDNIKYIDLEEYLSLLERIYITYGEDSSLGYNGAYNPTIGYINYNSAKEKINESTKTHELLHTLTNYRDFYDFFTESINVMFNNEYFKKDYYYDESYSYNQKYIYFVREIIGIEPLINYHFNGNINIILEALYNIIPDEQKCYALIEEL